MLVAVKKPRTKVVKIRIEEPAPWLVDDLKRLYGRNFKVLAEEDAEEIVNVFDTEWYKGAKKKETPGGNLRSYRENRGFTQEGLGKMLGVPKQYVSNLETGQREISKRMAIRLARILRVPVGRFIF